MFPNIASGGAGGGDQGARAAGFSDYSDYLNKKAQATSGGGGGSSGGVGDPVAMAKQLQQFQIQANQPAIATLGSQQQDLQTRYSSLLDSIKGQGSVAVNAQTLATNNTLGARGILGDSALAQSQMAQSLLPVTEQYAGLTSQTGVAEQQDIGNIASQIAQLQAGNPVAAGEQAANIYGAQTQAANVQAQLQNALQLQQQQLQYREIPYGGALFDPSTNQVVNQAGVKNAGMSSGGGIPQMTPTQPIIPPTSNGASSGGISQNASKIDLSRYVNNQPSYNNTTFGNATPALAGLQTGLANIGGGIANAIGQAGNSVASWLNGLYSGVPTIAKE